MSDGLDTARREAVAKIAERRQRAPFIKGPIPLAWITTAARLPGKAVAVGLALWWRRNLTGDNPVKLTTAHSLRFGVQTRSGRKAALDALERAGLVTVERAPPKAPSVTLIDLDPTTNPTTPPPKGPAVTDRERTDRYARRLVEWSDANPYKPLLAASLSALGGKYRPTSAAEDRIIMAEEAEVARLRSAVVQRTRRDSNETRPISPITTVLGSGADAEPLAEVADDPYAAAHC